MSVHLSTSIDEVRGLVSPSSGPVVVVPVYNGYDDVVQCYEALLRHTPVGATILVIDDGSVDRRVVTLLEARRDQIKHEVVVLVRPSNGGFIAGCNEAFAICDPHDVILVNSDVVVAAEWYERLCAAATSSNLIATASTLTNHGTVLSLPIRNTPSSAMPDGLSVDAAAAAVAQQSLKLRPTIPTAVGHCVYVKRTVLNLVGGFDPAFGRGYGEEVDFCQRAVRLGFRHVCADDVFTYHRGGATFGAEARATQDRNERLVQARYPWYRDWVNRASNDAHSALALALEIGAAALTGMRIGIDATCLGTFWAGTHVVAFETVLAIARRLAPQELIVFVAPHVSTSVRQVFAQHPNVTLEEVADVRTHEPDLVVDVVYRPYQVYVVEELEWLRRVGRRVIVSQLDVIAWNNPAYFASESHWLELRELTRLTLAVADGVTFISEHARRECAAEGMLIDSVPTAVVHCAVARSELHAVSDGAPVRPPTIPDDGRGLLLCLGVAYAHKNRTFAMQIWRALRARGWDGRLVLAGPAPLHGNSRAGEAEILLEDPGLRDDLVLLGAISEGEKNWLYSRSALVLYPTTSEGFGMVPFEAARLGIPTLSTRQGSLDEVLPDDIPVIENYSVDDAAALAWELITDRDAAQRLCAAIRTRGEQFTADHVADAVISLAHEVSRRPRRRVAAWWGEDTKPSSLGALRSNSLMSMIGAWVERGIQRAVRLEGAKRVLIPDGSRRREVARQSVSALQRVAGKG